MKCTQHQYYDSYSTCSYPFVKSFTTYSIHKKRKGFFGLGKSWAGWYHALEFLLEFGHKHLNDVLQQNLKVMLADVSPALHQIFTSALFFAVFWEKTTCKQGIQFAIYQFWCRGCMLGFFVTLSGLPLSLFGDYIFKMVCLHHCCVEFKNCGHLPGWDGLTTNF